MKATLLPIPMAMVCQGRRWIRLKKAIMQASLEELPSSIATANQKPKSSSQKDLPTAIKGKFLSSLSFKLGKSKGDGITI